jgi:hypothetical protein
VNVTSCLLPLSLTHTHTHSLSLLRILRDSQNDVGPLELDTGTRCHALVPRSFFSIRASDGSSLISVLPHPSAWHSPRSISVPSSCIVLAVPALTVAPAEPIACRECWVSLRSPSSRQTRRKMVPRGSQPRKRNCRHDSSNLPRRFFPDTDIIQPSAFAYTFHCLHVARMFFAVELSSVCGALVLTGQ